MIDIKYATHNREPFFEIATNYIKPESKVLDIGSGNGSFPDYCKRDDFYLFDGNLKTVEELKKKYINSFCGLLPSLPFDDNYFDVIHCSHVVEHLTPDVFFETLKEMDRCLKSNGYLVISAPLFWSGFFNDLSHIRPYNPRVYQNYLCGNQLKSRTRIVVSENYKQEKLVYRFNPSKGEINYSIKQSGFLNKLFSKILSRIFSKGFTIYEKTGYTIVLKKG